MIENKFKFIDLFAGIGGFHIAMHENGGECVFASELDKFARQTYEENFKNTSPDIFGNGNFNIDITDPNLNYDSIPEFDVLCGGFPCQPFSHAGIKKGFNDTRGTLFFNIQEIIHSKIKANRKDKKVKVPKVILLENVKGFRNHDKGKTFETIESVLNKMGYQVSSEVTNEFDLASYISTVRTSVIACGILFELPIIIYFLTKVGLVTPEIMKKYRKIALVIVLILSAVITPPDVTSQIIVAIPVLILYQVSIYISKRVLKNEAKKARKAEKAKKDVKPS